MNSTTAKPLGERRGQVAQAASPSIPSPLSHKTEQRQASPWTEALRPESRSPSSAILSLSSDGLDGIEKVPTSPSIERKIGRIYP